MPTALESQIDWMERQNRFTKPAARPKGWSDEEKQRLAKLAKRGVVASEIAAILGRHTTSVRRMAREMKLLLRKEAAN